MSSENDKTKKEKRNDLNRSKAALIRIYEILRDYSDYDHLLTHQDIENKLDCYYNLGMERKAIARNIGVLEDAGIEIEHKKNGCYLVSRPFSDPEIRMLIDCVLCSKHISAKQSKNLIDRLVKLGNEYFKVNVKHVFTVGDWGKTDNEALFYNIELICKAIEKKKQIHYDYNKYSIDKKLQKTSEQYASPYQLILHNQRYYLMAYSDYWGNMVFHRLDHMTNMSITRKAATHIRDIKGYESGIDYKKFNSQLPYMYTDDPKSIELIADSRIIDDIIDWFGTDVRLHYLKNDDTKVHVDLKASPLAMKNWALQYLEHVEVVTPKELRAEIKKAVKAAISKYE